MGEPIHIISQVSFAIMKIQVPIIRQDLALRKIQNYQTQWPCLSDVKGALPWYGKLTWESAHAWILKILCYLIVWGITLIFMVRLSFYAIPLLIYDVMNDITIIP